MLDRNVMPHLQNSAQPKSVADTSVDSLAELETWNTISQQLASVKGARTVINKWTEWRLKCPLASRKEAMCFAFFI